MIMYHQKDPVINDKMIALESDIEKMMYSHQELLPRELYHYTSSQGLLGILGSNNFWATNIQYCNDSSEVKYGSELIKEIINEKLLHVTNDHTKVFLERTLRGFNPFSNGFADIYITCFCEESNLLSQWRGYANNGGGYSIGINTHRALNVRDRNYFILKVIYDEVLQRKLVSDSIDSIVQTFESCVTSTNAEDLIPSFCSFFTNNIGEFLIMFKHPNFSEEKEWRLVSIKTSLNRDEWINDIKFRLGGNKLIPYIELSIVPFSGINLGKLPLLNITFGPTLPPELTTKSLHLLLRKHDYHHIEVRSSNIPYTL